MDRFQQIIECIKKNEYEVVPIGKFNYKIKTRQYDENNQPYDIFLRKHGKHIFFTDGGQLLERFGTEREKFLQWISKLLAYYHIKLSKDRKEFRYVIIAREYNHRTDIRYEIKSFIQFLIFGLNLYRLEGIF